MAECGHTFHFLCLITNVLYNRFECPLCQAADDDDDEEEQWGAESDSCDEFGSGYGAVEYSDDADDTNSLLHDDVLRGFHVLDGVDHDDADDVVEEYYNIRFDLDEAVADYNDNV